jgi:hypothetical protein
VDKELLLRIDSDKMISSDHSQSIKNRVKSGGYDGIFLIGFYSLCGNDLLKQWISSLKFRSLGFLDVTTKKQCQYFHHFRLIRTIENVCR